MRSSSIIPFIISCSIAIGSFAAEFNSMPGSAQFRGAAFDVNSGFLLLSAYDKNQVWAVNPADGERVWTGQTAQGPASLAINSAGIVAVAARLDGTVSFFDAKNGASRGELVLSDGVTDLAAAGKGFLAISTFSDTVYYLSTSVAGNEESVLSSIPVPSRVVADGGYAYILSKTPNTVHVFDISSTPPRVAGSISLTTPARDIVALPEGRVAVLDASGISIFDARNQTRRIRRTLSGLAIAASNDNIFVLSEKEVQKLNSSAEPEEKLALDSRARLIYASGELLTALDPVNSTWSLYNPKGIVATPGLPTEAPGEFEMAEAPTVEPNAPSESTEVPIIQPQPAPAVEDEIEPLEEPVDSVETESAEESTEIDVAPTTVSPDTLPVRPLQGSMHSGGLGMPTFYGGPRAPHPGEPSAVPIDQFDQQSIADALKQPAIFAQDGGGFQLLDLAQLEMETAPITADNASIGLDGVYRANGNVRMEIGNIVVTSDSLEYQTEPILFSAEGNVRIEQEQAFLTADTLRFEETPSVVEAVTEDEDSPVPPIFREDNDSKSLPDGFMSASNLHVVEPGRELTISQFEYNFTTETGVFEDVSGWAGIYYFHADHLDVKGRRSFDGDDVWITTCDRNPPHYKIRLSKVAVEDGNVTGGTSARLQFGNTDTPVFLPKWRHGGSSKYPWTLSFDSGRQADIGYYVNVGQRYEVDPDVGVGPRLYITEKEGVGFGVDLDYNFTERPASRLFRSYGEAHVLRTTEENGLAEWYHRYEYSPDLALRLQVEHWDDRDFYKDFYYDLYRHRTEPRTFANVTLRRDNYIATGSVAATTHGWASSTEKLPELTFHLLDRPLWGDLRVSFDSINGYYNAEPNGANAVRSVNVGRLSYDWDITEAFNVTPYLELEGAWYSHERFGDDSRARLTSTVGVTAQTRFHRVYNGRWGFSAFKHVVVPSITYSFRPDSTLELAESPRFDALDKYFGRSRIESKLDNVVYGRDAETGEIWQVGRLSLYQGNDFASELKKTDDYEIEIDIRPRPWWGFQFVGERHITGEDEGLEWFGRVVSRGYEQVFDRTPPWSENFDYNREYGDFSRTLSQIYFDDTINGGRFKGRLGFAYTRTRDETFNREIHYGVGYRLGEKWGIGIEHIYDIEAGDLRTQTYEVRRSLHAWEAAFRVRSRESGVDLNLEFNIKAFPGSSVKL